MGLTKNSVGVGAAGLTLPITKGKNDNITIALAGNPNVGKSSVFNALTGMNQHTGNWAGKTVTAAVGICRGKARDYTLVDLPGTYSLSARSAEEEVARDFICSDKAQAVVVVCDATCIERNMNLVLQILEATPKVIVCVNLMDEAKHRGIEPNLKKLSEKLGVPVVGTCARKKATLKSLIEALDNIEKCEKKHYTVTYPEKTESAIKLIETALINTKKQQNCQRAIAIQILLGNIKPDHPEVNTAYLAAQTLIGDDIGEEIAAHTQKCAEKICKDVCGETSGYRNLDRKLDSIITGRITAYPLMLILLAGILWLTITGANYPSQWLSNGFDILEIWLIRFLDTVKAPDIIKGILIDGIWRTLSSVVSVMLPPMAIFFPLFTLLEDSGFLPRIAYNLDRPFKKCNACGKQALTMCMGFGCNAAGVIGCRIIDSPRERLLAILTNSLVPCNGRFPTLIALIGIFFISGSCMLSSLLSALILTAFILLSILVTFLTTKLLSNTLLKGYPSSFTLELPPYRRPQIGKVIVRSVFDRTLFVLGRSVAVAIPAGLILWLFANIKLADASILSHCCSLLDPFARLLGLDGVLLCAFILGFPANETVIPIATMGYLAQSTLGASQSLNDLGALFTANGWTPVTALCVIVFMLFHWPCSTTLITVKKETGSIKWAVIAAAIPTVIGIILCFLIKFASNLIYL